MRSPARLHLGSRHTMLMQVTARAAAAASGYSARKITENIDCEIFATPLEEAQESYDADVVRAMRSDTAEDMERNVEAIKAWHAERCGAAAPA